MTTEHAHYRLRGEPLIDGQWSYLCLDCGDLVIGTPQRVIAELRTSHGCPTPELVQGGPDGDLRVGLIAALSVLITAGAVVPLVWAAVTGSPWLMALAAGMAVGGLLGLRWAWRNGVER